MHFLLGAFLCFSVFVSCASLLAFSLTCTRCASLHEAFLLHSLLPSFHPSLSLSHVPTFLSHAPPPSAITPSPTHTLTHTLQPVRVEPHARTRLVARRVRAATGGRCARGRPRVGRTQGGGQQGMEMGWETNMHINICICVCERIFMVREDVMRVLL